MNDMVAGMGRLLTVSDKFPLMRLNTVAAKMETVQSWT
jgi:hypothetical protein